MRTRILLTLTLLMAWAHSALAQESSLTIGKKSAGEVNVIRCQRESDAESLLIAFVQGGVTLLQHRIFILSFLKDNGGTSLCAPASGRLVLESVILSAEGALGRMRLPAFFGYGRIEDLPPAFLFAAGLETRNAEN